MLWERKLQLVGETRTTTIRYYVTDAVYDPETECFCYGLGIQDETEAYLVRAFSKERTQAIRAAEMLWRGQVMPISFYDVLDDYLAQMYASNR